MGDRGETAATHVESTSPKAPRDAEVLVWADVESMGICLRSDLGDR